MSTHKIAAGNPITLETATELLKAGGNAYDAAVGAVFTSMTSEYTLTGPCGGGALLAVPADKKPIVFDFFVDSPSPQRDKPLDFFDIVVDFGSAEQVFHIGRGSVAIPGNVAGLLHVHKKLGTLPLKTVLEPAIHAARNGVVVDSSQAYIFRLLKPIFCYDKTGSDFFQPHNQYVQSGHLFKNPVFATVLEHLISEGKSFIYEGDGAQYILNMQENGGWITRDQLTNYRVVERTPVYSTLQDFTLLSNPTPSVGGTLMAFLFKLLESKNEHLSTITIEMLVDTMIRTSLARYSIHSNPDDEHELDRLLQPEVIKQFAMSNLGDQAISDPFSRGATTHLSILDKDGNASSVTTTNGEGCGVFIPELGIMMNNMLGEEDVNPLGFHVWNTQRRLPSMISPSVIVKDGKPEMVLGSGGSNRIRSAIIQVIIHYLYHGCSLEDSIEKSRIHVEGKTIHTEPGLSLVLPRGYHQHSWSEHNMFFGGVNAVTHNSAVGDSRRGGVGVTIE